MKSGEKLSVGFEEASFLDINSLSKLISFYVILLTSWPIRGKLKEASLFDVYIHNENERVSRPERRVGASANMDVPICFFLKSISHLFLYTVPLRSFSSLYSSLYLHID